MGVSTDGIICCGLAFNEGCEFPWSRDGEHGQDELEAWWEGRDEDQKLPIELINYCSSGVPMYVVAIRGSRAECGRGYPLKLTPDAMSFHPDDFGAYMEFVRKHLGKKTWDELNTKVHREYEKPLTECPEPTWLLCSYWSA